MVGMSLVMCVADVIQGRVQETDVEKIISGTAIANEEDLKKVLKHYCQHYWQDDPDRASELTIKWFKAGKIEQPKLTGGTPPAFGEGTWWWQQASDPLPKCKMDN